VNALVVGPGPALPFLHEARATTRALGLDPARTRFFEQRASSVAAAIDEIASAARAHAVAMGGPVVAIGISFGGSFAIEAAARDPRPFRAIVGLGIDIDIAVADRAAHAFVVEHGSARAREDAARFAAPVLTSRAFQLRGKRIAQLGGIQTGTSWGAMMRGAFFGLVRTRGPIGAVRALRAMTRAQDAILPELSTWSLHHVRALAVPVALVHGAQDAVAPPALARAWLDAVDAPGKTLRILDGVAHLPHAEAPQIVREVLAAIG
jgi:pimeloyl-ACP methyl ester carboxylesterase